MTSPFLEVAQDLSADLAADQRYQRLIAVARKLIPCDSVALLRLDAGVLVPIVMDGLRAEAVARRFAPGEHPRLARILAAPGPVRFTDPVLPDPFDGLFGGGDVRARAHGCIGCRLVVGGEIVGVLAVDALDPHAFDDVGDDTVAMLAALAGAALHTTLVAQALEQLAVRHQLVAQQLVREALAAGGGEILGSSPPIVRVRQEIELLARSELTTLISGETGVGK